MEDGWLKCGETACNMDTHRELKVICARSTQVMMHVVEGLTQLRHEACRCRSEEAAVKEINHLSPYHVSSWDRSIASDGTNPNLKALLHHRIKRTLACSQ